MLFLSCQSRELGHNAFTREWLEGWLSSALPFLKEMVESAGGKKKVFLVFVSPLLTLLFFSAHSLHVSRHGWKPIWHKSWDLMEKSNGRFIGLPKEKTPSFQNFQRGRLSALLPPVGVRSRVSECHPWWWRRPLMAELSGHCESERCSRRKRRRRRSRGANPI